MTEILKLLLGEVPARGAIKMVLFGALLAGGYFVMKDMRQSDLMALRGEIRSSKESTDSLTAELVRYNNVQNMLMRRADFRLRRLYEANNWDYESIQP